MESLGLVNIDTRRRVNGIFAYMGVAEAGSGRDGIELEILENSNEPLNNNRILSETIVTMRRRGSQYFALRHSRVPGLLSLIL